MPFGKRLTPPTKAAPATSQPSQAAVAAPPATSAAPPSSPAQRYSELREAIQALFQAAGKISTAVTENTSIEMSGLDVDINPLGPPFMLRGFEQFFVFDENGTTMRSAYVYADVPGLSELDNKAQFHLHRLIGRMMEFNAYCQQAVQDDALLVALQSPKLPPMIDRIIVGCTFFMSFFETAERALPYLTATPMRALPNDEIGRLRESMERHRLMAFDRMLQPHNLEDMLPTRKWPIIGVETRWPAHAGERFINGVYFPANQASEIDALEAQRQANASAPMAIAS